MSQAGKIERKYFSTNVLPCTYEPNKFVVSTSNIYNYNNDNTYFTVRKIKVYPVQRNVNYVISHVNNDNQIRNTVFDYSKQCDIHTTSADVINDSNNKLQQIAKTLSRGFHCREMVYSFEMNLVGKSLLITCHVKQAQLNTMLKPVGLHDTIEMTVNEDFLKMLNQELTTTSFEFERKSEDTLCLEFKNVWNGYNLFLHGSCSISTPNNFMCEVPNENSDERFNSNSYNGDMLFWFTYDGVNIIKLKHELFILELTWTPGTQN